MVTLTKPSEQELSAASRIGSRINEAYGHLFLTCDGIVWLTPAGHAPTKLSPKASERFLDKLLDVVTLELKVKVPPRSGEPWRYIKSAAAMECAGPRGVGLRRTCPSCALHAVVLAVCGSDDEAAKMIAG